MSFNLKDYEEVKDRLPRFWSDPSLTKPRLITTCLTPEENLVSEAHYRCELYDGDDLLVSGEAMEYRTDKGVNSTSHLENCETSAIGRALANGWWSSGKNRPSREEMEKVERMKDAPKPDSQQRLLAKLVRETGYTQADLLADYKVEHTADLTKSQKSFLIDELKKRQEQASLAERLAEATGGTVE